MSNEGFNQTRINGRHQEPHDVLVELAGSIELGQAVGFHFEVSDPVGSLTLAIDLVSQLAFFPKSTREDFATEALNELLQRTRHSTWVAIVFVAVKDQKAVVALSSQNPNSRRNSLGRYLPGLLTKIRSYRRILKVTPSLYQLNLFMQNAIPRVAQLSTASVASATATSASGRSSSRNRPNT